MRIPSIVIETFLISDLAVIPGAIRNTRKNLISQKNIIRCCVCLVTLISSFSSFGQYKGGAADGFSISTTSFQNRLNNIYKGNANDGFHRQLTTGQNLLNNVYKGAADDGFGRAIQLSQNRMNNIYSGGADDGFGHTIQLSQNTLNNIYRGGSDDGFGKFIQLSQNRLNNIYNGGADDGFGKIMQLSQNRLNNIYAGGINDGYATIIIKNQNPLNVLPLDLLEFSGRWQQQSILLFWRTVNEQDLDHFELEKKSDQATHFENIAIIPATGFSGTEQLYTFNDPHTQNGTVFYYRLKSVDRNGDFSYSAIVRLVKTDKGKIYTIFPNPGIGLFTIGIHGINNLSAYSYRVFNNQGAIITHGGITASNTLVDISRFAAGNYYLQILYNQQTESIFKIIVQH
jgi:hypothetical protein